MWQLEHDHGAQALHACAEKLRGVDRELQIMIEASAEWNNMEVE